MTVAILVQSRSKTAHHRRKSHHLDVMHRADDMSQYDICSIFEQNTIFDAIIVHFDHILMNFWPF